MLIIRKVYRLITSFDRIPPRREAEREQITEKEMQDRFLLQSVLSVISWLVFERGGWACSNLISCVDDDELWGGDEGGYL